jgi:hypothetical protein
MDNLALKIIDEVLENNEQGFVIKDDKAAEWALKKIAEESAESQRMVNVCDTMINEYQFKKQKAQEELEKKTSYLREQLRLYFEKVPHVATKTQEVYKLPSGTLKMKFGGIEYKRDDDTLVKWLEDSGRNELVKVKKEADWATLKKDVSHKGNVVITADGEIVSGVVVQEKPNTFHIEF